MRWARRRLPWSCWCGPCCRGGFGVVTLNLSQRMSNSVFTCVYRNCTHRCVVSIVVEIFSPSRILSAILGGLGVGLELVRTSSLRLGADSILRRTVACSESAPFAGVQVRHAACEPTADSPPGLRKHSTPSPKEYKSRQRPRQIRITSQLLPVGLLSKRVSYSIYPWASLPEEARFHRLVRFANKQTSFSISRTLVLHMGHEAGMEAHERSEVPTGTGTRRLLECAYKSYRT
jgi:hypothetical protein